MKTPLVPFYNVFGHEIGVHDKDQNIVPLSRLCALANSHAAQPGAPREDGWFTAKLLDLPGDRVIERRDGKCFLGHVAIQEQFVLAHRKHQPLEVPK